MKMHSAIAARSNEARSDITAEGVAERTPGVEDVMERVSSPSQLPGAEVVLPGLLVEVSENQEEQQSNNGRHYKQTNRDAVHGAKTATSARVISNF